MTIYVITEVSSGEVPVEFDNQEVYTDKKIAEEVFKKRYQEQLKSVSDYEITEDYFSKSSYEIVIEDEDGEATTYAGQLKEFEV